VHLSNHFALPPAQAHLRNPYGAKPKEAARLRPQGGHMYTWHPGMEQLLLDDDGEVAAALLLEHWKVRGSRRPPRPPHHGSLAGRLGVALVLRHELACTGSRARLLSPLGALQAQQPRAAAQEHWKDRESGCKLLDEIISHNEFGCTITATRCRMGADVVEVSGRAAACWAPTAVLPGPACSAARTPRDQHIRRPRP
jgi:hypothetical protein